MTNLLALALGMALPLGPGAVAHVDDPSSHGQLGDGLLSLDEAIRLANGTVTPGQLSKQEKARISGSANAVDRIVVDAAVVPGIQLTATLAPLAGSGSRIELEGVAYAGRRPVLWGNGVPAILELATWACTVRGIAIHGGAVGIAATDIGGDGIDRAVLEDLHLEGQTRSGFHLEVTGGAPGNSTSLFVHRVGLRAMPLGFRIVDRGLQGGLLAITEHLSFEGVGLGIDLDASGRDATSKLQLWRSRMVRGNGLLRVRRDPASTQRQMLRIVHGHYVVAGDLVDVQGVSGGDTVFHHHHAHLESANGRVVHTHPRTARFDLHGSENTFVGDIEIHADRFTQRIWHNNNEYLRGRMVIDNDGAVPELLWNRWQGCTLEVPRTARTPVRIETCELHRCDVVAPSGFAPVTLENTFRSGGTLTGSVSEVRPAPSPWWGRTKATPAEPRLGGSLTLEVDLPRGMAAVWYVAESFARPKTTAFPFRFYGDTASGVSVLPGLHTGNTQAVVTVPRDPALVGVELYLQAVSRPTAGQGHVPVVHLPRGSLVRPRF